MAKHDDLQPLTITQIAQIGEYLAKLERQHKSLWDIPEGEELSWEMRVTPELVILYCDGVEDYNPWYEAWPVGPGESPFGTAIVPPLLLGYWQKWFHRQARGAGEVGGVAAAWDTEVIAPCPVGTLVRYRARQVRRYIKRGRQYVRAEITVEDASTGQLFVRHAREALAKYAKVE